MSDLSARQAALLALLPSDRPVEVVDLREDAEVRRIYRRLHSLTGDLAELVALGPVERVDGDGVRRLPIPGPPAE